MQVASPHPVGDETSGLVNLGNTCVVNTLAQAVLNPVAAAYRRQALPPGPPPGSGERPLFESLLGVATQRGSSNRHWMTVALCGAIALGTGEIPPLQIGPLGNIPGPLLDLKEILHRSLQALRAEDPVAMTAVDWSAACHGTCRNPNCDNQGRAVEVSCNPILMRAQEGGLDDTQDMVGRHIAFVTSTPHPCQICCVDSEPAPIARWDTPPPLRVLHRVLDNDARDVSRVLFRETIEVLGVRYRLTAMIRYVDASLDTGGGHYAGYVKRQSAWMLHDGTFTAEEDPDLDHPKHTTALYTREVRPTMEGLPVPVPDGDNALGGPTESPGEPPGPAADPEAQLDGQPTFIQFLAPVNAPQGLAPSPQEPRNLPLQTDAEPGTEDQDPLAGVDLLLPVEDHQGPGSENMDDPMGAGHGDGTGDAAEGPPVVHAVDNAGCIQKSEERRPGKGTKQVPILEKRSSTTQIKACAALGNKPPAQKEDHHTPVAADAHGGPQTGLPAREAESDAKASQGRLPSMTTVISRISDALTNSREQTVETSRARAKNPLDFPPRHLSHAVRHDLLSQDVRDTDIFPQSGPGAPSPGGQNVACQYTSTLASGPGVSAATLPCPLHKPAKGHLCGCDMRFCDLHAGRIVGLGQHEGQCRASALPRATQTPTLDSGLSQRDSQEPRQHPDPALVAAAANAAAKALVYTTLTKVGGRKAVPTVEHQGMVVYYDASQLADTGAVMRARRMAVVQLPHPAVEDTAMPAHLATYVDQLPAQFQIEDVVLRREKITLLVYDLQPPRIIRPGPEGRMRAYTVTNGDVTTDTGHAPPFTRTMTYMCPADIPTSILTPRPGGGRFSLWRPARLPRWHEHPGDSQVQASTAWPSRSKEPSWSLPSCGWMWKTCQWL